MKVEIIAYCDCKQLEKEINSKLSKLNTEEKPQIIYQAAGILDDVEYSAMIIY